MEEDSLEALKLENLQLKKALKDILMFEYGSFARGKALLESLGE